MHLWVTWICTCGSSQIKNPYLDLCRYQAPGTCTHRSSTCGLASTHHRSRSHRYLQVHMSQILATDSDHMSTTGTHGLLLSTCRYHHPGNTGTHYSSQVGLKLVGARPTSPAAIKMDKMTVRCMYSINVVASMYFYHDNVY